MKILIACEYSGVVRDEFIKRGHNAVSCDILASEAPGPHYQGDVLDILYNGWDMIIAHPPCTYLANSGVSWLHKDESRWTKLDNGASFFKLFLDHPCDRVAIENPIMHKYAIERIGGVKQTQTIQPYEYGHPETKRTCLWLKGLPPLRPTNNVKHIFDMLPNNERQRLHYLPPSADRQKLRSKTFFGIARAMAEQWGDGFITAVQIPIFNTTEQSC